MINKKKLSLVKALRLDHIPLPRVAFVGAGGKTTALFQLARELSPCIVTTTTHLGAWQAKEADQHIIIRKAEDVNQLEKIAFSRIILVTGEEKENRLPALSDESLKWLEQFSNYHSLPLLIEADGSRQKALKAPKENEPVIPDFIERVIVVAGLSGMGKISSEETIYNAESFIKLGKMKEGKKIRTENLTKVLLHKNGGLKNIPTKARRIALLTQANTPELESISGKIAKQLIPKFDSVITTNFSTSNIQTFQPAAAIILAAGASSRFGQPKQLLDYHGKPFIRAVAEKALQAELSPVIVVTGAEDTEIREALKDLPIEIVHNSNWKEGQSSSIQMGIKKLPTNTGAAIFLLTDQPQVTPTIMRALVEEHQRTLKAVIAPMVEDRRANPVLFDRATFPALLELKGDIGGRGIFSKFSPSYILWLDSSLLLDVDTDKDYQKLINGKHA
ncbi:MAG: putative selenium-dependent hydroxylase accessory protein YqeC [Chloroflexi bacterium]|nr:putative selenium-dependent hydroxylase accessory protein YqeC [Chloroflexota bacterium]